jgi:hypothetical protein
MLVRGARVRLLRAALVVGGASAALSLAGPDALVPFKEATAAAATVGVAFVIDFGSGAPVVGCVHVPSSDNGYAALSAFTAQDHLATPTYNQSGLLCSIGGVPAGGCGQQVPGGYDYWSYWHGASGTWAYSEVGAFAAVQAGDVEGWRYENPGHANANDPPPTSAPDYAAICPAMAQSSSPADSAATSPAPPSSSEALPSSGRTSGGPTSSNAPTGSAVTTTTVAAPSPTSAHSSTANTGRPTSAPESSVAGRSSSTTTDPRSGSTGRTQALGPTRTPPGGQGSGGSPAPLAIGGALVAAVAAAAAWRWRRRPRAP